MNRRALIAATRRSVLLGAICCGLTMASVAAERQNREPASSMPAGKIELDETVISGNQELPKVLYIVPWQQPDGLPEIELRTDFAEVEVFRRLYPPAYRRELAYFEAATATAPAGAQGPAEPGRESKASDAKE